MKRVLLLLPTTGHRNNDFLAAAKKLGVGIVATKPLFLQSDDCFWPISTGRPTPQADRNLLPTALSALASRGETTCE